MISKKVAKEFVNIYQCEICKKEYKYSCDAEICEKQCNCAKEGHKDFIYYQRFDWDSEETYIVKECKCCEFDTRKQILESECEAIWALLKSEEEECE